MYKVKKQWHWTSCVETRIIHVSFSITKYRWTGYNDHFLFMVRFSVCGENEWQMRWRSRNHPLCHWFFREMWAALRAVCVAAVLCCRRQPDDDETRCVAKQNQKIMLVENPHCFFNSLFLFFRRRSNAPVDLLSSRPPLPLRLPWIHTDTINHTHQFVQTSVCDNDTKTYKPNQQQH